jgi:Flp pilus assembly protein TadB
VIAAVLLAVAVMSVPTGRAGIRGTSRTTTPDERLSRRALSVGAGAAAAVAAVALLGVRTGMPAALLAAPVAAWTVHRLPAARPGREPDLPLTLDLVAVVLRAGRPGAQAVELALDGASEQVATVLTQVAALLRLGADPEEAWRPAAAHPSLAPVAAAARRSSASGAKLAAAFEECAAQLRRDGATEAHGRAARAGVLTLLPLGLCFLPAFVCIGIVPVVVGVARSAFLSGTSP